MNSQYHGRPSSAAEEDEPTSSGGPMPYLTEDLGAAVTVSSPLILAASVFDVVVSSFSFASVANIRVEDDGRDEPTNGDGDKKAVEADAHIVIASADERTTFMFDVLKQSMQCEREVVFFDTWRHNHLKQDQDQRF